VDTGRQAQQGESLAMAADPFIQWQGISCETVTENKGKNTPGVDKETWKTSRAKTNAIASLKRRGYSALPLRRVLIPKKNGKMRALGIPVMRCRAMQALRLLALEPVAETTADPNSYLRYKLSLRDLVEMMTECSLSLAHTTIMRWIKRFTPKFVKCRTTASNVRRIDMQEDLREVLS
jgi:hypothetical protein